MHNTHRHIQWRDYRLSAKRLSAAYLSRRRSAQCCAFYVCDGFFLIPRNCMLGVRLSKYCAVFSTLSKSIWRKGQHRHAHVSRESKRYKKQWRCVSVWNKRVLILLAQHTFFADCTGTYYIKPKSSSRWCGIWGLLRSLTKRVSLTPHPLEPKMASCF